MKRSKQLLGKSIKEKLSVAKRDKLKGSNKRGADEYSFFVSGENPAADERDGVLKADETIPETDKKTSFFLPE